MTYKEKRLLITKILEENYHNYQKVEGIIYKDYPELKDTFAGLKNIYLANQRKVKRAPNIQVGKGKVR